MNNAKNIAKRALVVALATALLPIVAPLALADDAMDRFQPLRSTVNARDVDREVPQRPAFRPHQPRPGKTAIFKLVVTDADPAQLGQAPVIAQTAKRYHAHDTLNLHIVAALRPEMLGEGAFEQVTTFVLPDGSVYESRITPMDLEAEEGATIKRADLAPHPVPVARLKPLGVTDAPSVGRLKSRPVSGLSFSQVMLPVSGTWITQHNLYGTWTVEVKLIRGDDVLGTATTTFDLFI